MSSRLNIDLLGYVQGRTSLQKKVYQTSDRGKEYKGPCPMCGGKDRFRVQPEYKDGRWYCRQCAPKGGNLIALIMQVENLDFRAAAKKYDSRSPKPHPVRRTSKTMEDKNWQEAVGAYVDRAASYLESLSDAKNTAKLDWLTRTRGIDKEILRSNKVGFSPMDFVYKDIKFYKGYTIPNISDGVIYGVKIRLENGKYINIKGGKSRLYAADLVPHAPKFAETWNGNTLVLVESELDALMLYSVAYRALKSEKGLLLMQRVQLANTNFVALGGSMAPGPLWMGLCQSTNEQFIATDNDAPGEELATKFKGRRLAPTKKDPGEMWLEGGDKEILDWLLPPVMEWYEEEVKTWKQS